MSDEPMACMPLWLEFCGLTEQLSAMPKGAQAWALFKKLVEIDCELNSNPGVVEIALVELARRVAMSPGTARKAMPALRKIKAVAYFLPETDEEAGLFRVQVPLETPLGPEGLAAHQAHAMASAPTFYRYSVADSQSPSTEIDGKDSALQEVVDMYFNTVGMKMNAFVLDELRLLRERFELDQIRYAFRRARQNEIRSLNWVVQQLVKQASKKTED